MFTLPPSRRGASVLALAAALLISPGLAQAADAQPEAARKAEANAHLKRGAELIDSEDLPGALAQFEAAYRLVPSPSILHNFGIVYQGLGRRAEALAAFQRFLDEAEKAPPDAREHARQAVEVLRGQVAELRVACDVAGADILVDDRKVAQTPQEKPIHLDPGPHRLSVRKEGLTAVHTERIEVAGGQQLTVPARLLGPPAAAVAEVTTQPARSPRPWQRRAAWTTAAAATVATGALVTTLIVRHFRVKEHNDLGCGTKDKVQASPRCETLAQRANDAERWAIVSGATAGVLAAGAAVLFLTLPDSATEVSLQASPAQLGLGLQGRF